LQNVIEIYTDGACCGNPGKGGWGVLIKKGDRYYEYGGFEEDTTNNRMEMTAAIEAMVEVADEEGPIKLYTDSQYLKKGITQWIHTWKVNNWKTSGKEPVKNLDLWQELDELNKPNIQWEWVKGHASNPYNCRVDKIATSFAQEIPVELLQGEKADASFFEEECKTETAPKKKSKTEKPAEEIAEPTPEKAQPRMEVQAEAEKTRSINICLPFIENFAGTLDKKGFKKTVPGEGDAKYIFSGDNVKIDVFQSGIFTLTGNPSKVDELASGIADADDRYLEKWIKKIPLEFPGSPEQWKQKHFDAFVRTFYKKMPADWKYSFESNLLKIHDPENETSGFEIELSDEFSWKTPPAQDIYPKIKLYGESSVTIPDRFTMGFRETGNTKFEFALIPLDRQAVNLGQSRLWREINQHFDEMDDSEKNRIKTQISSHLGTYTRQSIDISEKTHSGGTDFHKNISQWLLDILNLYFMHYFKPQSKIKLDLVVEPVLKDIINEKMPTLKFSEKVGIRKAADIHENLALSFTGFFLDRM
jgi:ribonuclease HI